MKADKQKLSNGIKTNLYNQEGQIAGEVEIPSSVFGVKINPNLVQQAVLAHIGGHRMAIAHTKTRGEVRGGGRKPRPQKHSGQSRQGSIRSPQWRHGGIVFGPTSERVFVKKINKNMKRKALFMALSSKFNDNELVVLKDIKLEKSRTKEMANIFKKLPIKGATLVVLPKALNNFARLMRNIPSISVISADSLNTYDVLNAKYLLLLKDSINVIEKTYAS